jgi:hypothetical protein
LPEWPLITSFGEICVVAPEDDALLIMKSERTLERTQSPT